MRFNKFWIPTTIINLALLCSANVLPVLAGQSDPESSIDGKWTLLYDFSCSGKPSSSTITFNNDGTFSAGGSLTGNWSFAGDSIIFKFTNGTTYAGIEFSSTMKGRNTTYNNLGSLRGCWTANKTSGTSGTLGTTSLETQGSVVDSNSQGIGPDGQAK